MKQLTEKDRTLIEAVYAETHRLSLIFAREVLEGVNRGDVCPFEIEKEFNDTWQVYCEAN